MRAHKTFNYVCFLSKTTALFFLVEDVDPDLKPDKKRRGSTRTKPAPTPRPPIAGKADAIDKMKERATSNNVFHFIKIPEVPVRFSYKVCLKITLENKPYRVLWGN